MNIAILDPSAISFVYDPAQPTFYQEKYAAYLLETAQAISDNSGQIQFDQEEELIAMSDAITTLNTNLPSVVENTGFSDLVLNLILDVLLGSFQQSNPLVAIAIMIVKFLLGRDEKGKDGTSPVTGEQERLLQEIKDVLELGLTDLDPTDERYALLHLLSRTPIHIILSKLGELSDWEIGEPS